ncbi:MAG: dehypoxanthine futalosine cyclase [Sedimentisphaerales bacterium]|nr:dehypoxanthine futalosine cyclase [Sedimentisphaerales bacterium]
MIPANRLTSRQALELYQSGHLADLAGRADERCRQCCPAGIRTYVIERNINYTNVCVCRCRFCAFSVSGRHPEAYVLTEEQIAAKIEPLLALGGTQILLQGGLHPDLPFGWYEDLLGQLKQRYPRLHLHAFSPPEILHLAERFEMPLERVIGRLRDAGLDSLPGGGAEILVDRVRRIVSPAKCTADAWLDVMRRAHRLGLSTTATMMYGHAETPAERIRHLQRLRDLQDESLDRRGRDPNSGVLTAFTCWPYQPAHTRLAGRIGLTWPVGPYEQLKMTALSRLFLDNIANHQASWVTQGPKIGQISLLAGCNDLGSLMMEENVVSAAGTTYRLRLEQLRGLIETLGFRPVQRDYFYRQIDA